MPAFEYVFTVQAPLAAVAAFHRDTRALKELTPPPMIVQLHRVDPLADGSISEFTLWLGPLPLRWQAVHSGVDAARGFTDVQARGPLQRWRHTHHFEAVDAGTTRLVEYVEYEHADNWLGLLTRALFSRAGLRFLFTYRAWATRRALERGGLEEPKP